MDTVKKGAGRPAAAAKRRTHAQRTPLPPRKGQVKAAQEAVQEASKPARSTRATPKAQKPRAATTAGGKGTAYADTKSAAKATGYATKVAELGWAAKTEHHGEGSEVTATRDSEIIWVSWKDGKLVNRSGAPMATYALGNRTVVIRNVAEALKLAARDGKAAAAAQPQARSMRPKAERSDAPVRLPFDPGTAMDEEVVTALLGAQVQWVNSLSDGTETAWMPAAAHDIEVQEASDGDRTIKFCCRSGMYRAFRLSALVRVTGNRYNPRKRTAAKKK